MQCKFCGNENNDNAMSCYICGKSLVSNFATNFVDIGSAADTESAYAQTNGNESYTNRFASDTGGGPSIGPQRSSDSQIASGETAGSGASGVVVALILLIVAAVTVWLLFFSAAAPFAYMLPEALRFGSGSVSGAAPSAVINLFG